MLGERKGFRFIFLFFLENSRDTDIGEVTRNRELVGFGGVVGFFVFLQYLFSYF